MSKAKKKNKKEYVAVGGQALMEGIMMRGPKGMAMSLRLPDGSIETQMKDFVSIRKKFKPFNIPLIRGIVSFVESMFSGYKLLMESAEKTALDGMEAENESKLDKWLSDHFGPKMMSAIGFIAAVLGVAISFLLFMYMPTKLFELIDVYLVKGRFDISMWRALFEGIIRVILFLVYMVAVARMKDIRRVYMYHGAEHKTIFCFEHGKELTVANIREEKRFHPRCGTSFIFVTIILSILISSIVSIAFPFLTVNKWVWIATKVLMLPLIMGVGFEFIQLAGKYPNKFTRLLSAPGLLMQRITTVEPTDDIIEVAIEAMKGALTGEVPVKEEKPAEESAEENGEEESASKPEE